MVVAKLQVFDGAGQPFRAEEREFSPEDLAPGEALVEISLATVCGSDLHTFDGKRVEDTPCVLGHEAVGRVVAVADRTDVAIGDRVTWSIADSCGECPACTSFGLPEKCERLFKYGHAPLTNGSGLNGSYASHIVVRHGTRVVRLPDEVADAVAAPANCALATMVNAISGTPENVKKVVIQGGGMLGIYGCALLRERGVPDVYVTDLDTRRFDIIERFGGRAVDASQVDSDLDSVRGQIDAVFEVAGVKELIPQGVSLLRPGGFYGLVGLVHPDSALGITAEQLIRKCITLRGFHNYSPDHLDAAVEFLARNVGKLPFEDLVGPPVDLTRLDEAFASARKRDEFRVSVCHGATGQ